MSKIIIFVKKTAPTSLIPVLRMVYRIGIKCKNFFCLKLRSRLRLISQIGKEKISQEVLKTTLIQAGIKPGDIVMVHSSLSRIGNVEGGAETVINTFKETISTNGTIVMPAYSGFYENEYLNSIIDLRAKRSNVGIITEKFRTSSGVRRSSHPFQSICAWGKDADYITSNHDRGAMICHVDSPLARFVKMKGKIVGIGTSIGQVAVYHVIEDIWTFPFRIYENKPIMVKYIDNSGKYIEREILQRDQIVASTRIEKPGSIWLRKAFNRHLTKKGIIRWFKFGQAKAFIIDSHALNNELKKLAQKGITIYLTKSDWKLMNHGKESIDF